MYVYKNFSPKKILLFTGGHLVWITTWAVLVTVSYEYFHLKWLSIPWLPLSLIGTAVAFYIGFKNNQAYDRLWEARKIWGAIINSSRAWGSTVKSFVNGQLSVSDYTTAEIKAIHRRLLHRHIAWLYALRSQLLIPTQWEHVRQSRFMEHVTRQRMKRFGVG
ncbi:MAG: bestrophin family ion channel, partial [Bacteroidota bacterium]